MAFSTAMRCLLLTLTLLAACASTADARTIQQDLGVAQRYWKTDICRGEWKVLTDDPEIAAMRERGALASTRLIDCTIYLDPEVKGCDREAALRHEVGHFVNGPEHIGPMSTEVIDRVPCVGERLKVARVKARWRNNRARIVQWWRQ